jgi:hypothetical protein
LAGRRCLIVFFEDFINGFLGDLEKSGNGFDGESFFQGSFNELFFFGSQAIGTRVWCEIFSAVFAVATDGATPVITIADDGCGFLAVGAGINGGIHACDFISQSVQKKR